jgi:hypothetical protein
VAKYFAAYALLSSEHYFFAKYNEIAKIAVLQIESQRKIQSFPEIIK